MDSQMWENPAVAANVETLRGRGFTFAGPLDGRLASGRIGSGRMAEPAVVVDVVKRLLGTASGDLAGRRIVVSAGGTREPIDPVRYVGNHSSGKMGYAIAEAARDRGADVTLVTTVQHFAEPFGVTRIDAGTARQMLDALRGACSGADALVMAAAVADFRPRGAAEHKIKRSEVARDFAIPLEENPDVVAELRDLPMVRVGFAAESRDLLENARAKLAPKGLDFIVANDVSAEGSGFGTDTNAVSFLYPDGRTESLPLLAKYEVAHELIDRLLPLLPDRT
jgi:phosphopantothenoylcysteine decarboxylase/phosphopantothenate--cysteine ligase